MSVDDVTTFFATATPPAELERYEKTLADFVAFHAPTGRPLAVVTSGGTTVPLERNTVRFLDNFSGGTRGSASAEKFLEAGYAVIFLYRRHSLRPYSRKYSHTKKSFLDYMTLSVGDSTVQITPEFEQEVATVLKKYTKAKEELALLFVEFESVHDYLFLLRSVALATRPAGARTLFYLAAAVSDFYIPQQEMAQHKIQSSRQDLVVTFRPVPKLLGVLVSDWAPDAYHVSFKLETDAELLFGKASGSLSKYHHHLVVGNLLHNRQETVTMVHAGGLDVLERSPADRVAGIEIEDAIIVYITARHESFIVQRRDSQQSH